MDVSVVIFQNSLDSGNVPVNWKHANVTPLFKKGERQKLGKYKLVSLSSVVGKLLESIIEEELNEHLERDSSIHHCQHGL